MVDKPTNLNPVIAKIQHVNSLGLSYWFEIVFYDDIESAWRSFSGSKTFEDGEQVVAWSYCHNVKMDNEVK